MKYLLVLVLLVSFGSVAQCFKPIEAASVRYCSYDPGTGQYGPNTCSSAQPWLDLSGGLLPTEDTVDVCTGYWISSASDVRNAIGLEVNPAGFAKAFMFGLSLYLTFWFGPFCVRIAKTMINKL